MYQLPEKLQTPFVAAIESGNIRTMPNKIMPTSPLPRARALLLEDAFNMRHPLTGGGMTITLSNIIVLKRLFKPLRNLHSTLTICQYVESFYTLCKVSTCNSWSNFVHSNIKNNQSCNKMMLQFHKYLKAISLMVSFKAMGFSLSYSYIQIYSLYKYPILAMFFI